MADDDVPPEVWFDVSVMTKLRFPEPDDEDNDPGLEEAKDQYREDLAEQYRMAVFADQEAASLDDSDLPPPPNPVLMELAEVSAALRRLEVYRDKLIIFCRNVSADPETARAIAAVTGLSHTTVLRTGTVEQLAGVVAVAKPVAEAMLGWLDPAREPGLYRRLRQIRATSITE
jgi:hypothetical protein